MLVLLSGAKALSPLANCNRVIDRDVCVSEVPAFLIGAHVYEVQLVYSNEQHGCSSAP
jgi:hypothetical protein